ncbi:MAG: PLP-dependent aminotransferase family protein [bacterium]
MNIILDRDSRLPLYRQIIDTITNWVKSGELPPGASVPSVRQLARDLGVGIKTVRQAYDELVANGVLDTRQGSGTFVSDRPAGLVFSMDRDELREGMDELPPMIWQPYKFDTRFGQFTIKREEGVQVELSLAQPDPSLFPFERIKQVATNMLWYPKEMFFDRSHPQGYQPLVEYLEREMALAGVDMRPGVNEVIISGGFQRALSLILDLLAARGEMVAVEMPTYASILNLLIVKGIQCVGVPVDGAGMDTEYLAVLLRKERIKAIITVPTYHNPTGTVLANERRAHLLRLAAQHRVPVIEDDWGRALRYEGNAVPPLKALDTGGYVIHIGSFSKTFLPGLRIGWITLPGEIAVTTLRAKFAADKGDSWFLQVMLHEFISRGYYDKHLRKTLKVYNQRRLALLDALREHMPPEVSWIRPAGGLSLWLRLPRSIMSLQLQKECSKRGLEFATANFFNMEREDSSELRLSFGRASEEELREGARILAEEIRGLLAQRAGSVENSADFSE